VFAPSVAPEYPLDVAKGSSVFHFLFRLAADARVVTTSQFLRRLVTGLANHYRAATCSIYLYAADRLLASADPSRELEELAEAHRQSVRDIERRLVERAFESNAFVSGVDVRAELPPEWDVFAFPLVSGDTARAVVVLFLDGSSRPLNEGDVQALSALGEVLDLAAEPDRR
jgi:hypothetical protein